MNVLRTFVVVLLLAAGLAACGGNSDAEPSGPTLSDHSTATASATEASNGATATNDTVTRTSTATRTATTEDEKTEEPTAEATATTPGGSDDGDGNGSDGGAVDSGGYPDSIIPLGCGDILAPVDKGHQLPEGCEPADLVQLSSTYSDGYQSLSSDAAEALDEMFAAAQQAGYSLMVCSSYRSYDTQVQTYNYWVDTLGKEQADRTSARPGHSEHQLGTTADVQDAGFGCYLDESWGNTGAGQWLREHAHEFGFVISYPEGKEDITGYAYEPWHIRWVGEDMARIVTNSGQTLHEILPSE